MTDSTTNSTFTQIDVGGVTPAEVEVYTPDNSDAPMVVLRHGRTTVKTA